jgi:hypothetical protein
VGRGLVRWGMVLMWLGCVWWGEELSMTGLRFGRVRLGVVWYGQVG